MSPNSAKKKTIEICDIQLTVEAKYLSTSYIYIDHHQVIFVNF